MEGDITSRNARRIDKAFYRFVNKTDSSISIFWLKNLKERAFFRCLPPQAWVDIDTWDLHCWIFEDCKTGDYRVIRQNCVFVSQGMVFAKLVEKRRLKIPGPLMTGNLRETLFVLSPLDSLKTLALKCIRDSGISENDISKLELPKVLVETLKIIVQRRDCFLNHALVDYMCSECPYDLHRAHMHDTCTLPRSFISYESYMWAINRP